LSILEVKPHRGQTGAIDRARKAVLPDMRKKGASMMVLDDTPTPSWFKRLAA
jgi:hypothetical protein